MQIVVHRRQFAISREHAHLPARWRRVTLPGGYTLSHEPELAVTPIDETVGVGLLIGEAYGFGTDAACGRFASIAGTRVATDAAGLLALFYRIDTAGVVITSSPAVAKDFFGASPARRDLPRQGINWHPSPGSPMVGWGRLMADQRIDLAEGRLEDAPKSLAPQADENDAVVRLAEVLRSATVQIAARHHRVLIPLTAGLDSRTLFAAAIASNIKFETFTQVFGKNSEHDAISAARISSHYGIQHHVITGETPDATRARSLSRHSLESVHDADVTSLFPGGMYRHLRAGDVMLRGGLFELGRLDYHGPFYGLSLDKPGKLAHSILRRFREPPEGPLRPIIDAWVRHRTEHSLGLELGDAFFFDQDVGGWLSAVEQGLDSLAGVSMHPVNSLDALRCLMATTPRRRRAGVIQRRMIAYVDRELDKFDYNPVRQLRQRLRGSDLETVYYRLRALLPVNAV